MQCRVEYLKPVVLEIKMNRRWEKALSRKTCLLECCIHLEACMPPMIAIWQYMYHDIHCSIILQRVVAWSPHINQHQLPSYLWHYVQWLETFKTQLHCCILRWLSKSSGCDNASYVWGNHTHSWYIKFTQVYRAEACILDGYYGISIQMTAICQDLLNRTEHSLGSPQKAPVRIRNDMLNDEKLAPWL